MKFQGARERERITLLLENILPGLRDIDAKSLRKSRSRRPWRQTCVGRCGGCSRPSKVKPGWLKGVVKLVGAVYALKTGRVRFLP